MFPDVDALTKDFENRRLADVRKMLRRRAESLTATVILLSGEATAIDPETGRSHSIDERARLATGTKITIDRGRMLLRFDDGSDVWLAEGAELELCAWTKAERLLRLVAGRALALVAEHAERAFRTLTPHGEVIVTGTAFELNIHDSELDVAVLHGGVRLQTAGGECRVTRGRKATAAPGKAPALRTMSRSDDSARWVRDWSACDSNGAVRPALRGVHQTLDQVSRTRKEIGIMYKALIALAVLALAGGAAFFMFKSSDQSASSSAASEGAQRHVQAMAPGDGGGEEKEMAFATLDFPGSGKKLLVNLNDPNGLDEALSELPAEQAAALSRILTLKDGEIQTKPIDQMTDADRAVLNELGGLSVDVSKRIGDGEEPPLNNKQMEQFQREAQNSIDALRDMIKNGVDPEVAKAQVEAALTDSYHRHIGDDADVKVDLNVDPNSDGAQIGIRIEKGQ
ncbi:FecR family protein [bacterium]|nr:FecR family protein [bacterium]